MEGAQGWLGHGSEPETVAACNAAVATLGAAGIPLASVYLQSGSSLRCYAIAGYRQLFDGIGPDVGVIGRVWVSGVATSVTSESPAYRAAVPGVLDELCVPVFRHGECVGVVNAESSVELTALQRSEVVAAAAALSITLDELAPVSLTPAQCVLAHAPGIVESGEPNELSSRLFAAAADISGLTSGMLLLGEPAQCAAVSGPLGPALARIPSASLAEVDDWVRAGGSSRTAPTPSGQQLHGQQELLDAGAVGLAVVGLGTGTERLGSLLLAGPDRTVVDRETAEALELLAALAVTTLRQTDTMDRLRHAASTDPLTGLGNRNAFYDLLGRHLWHAQERRSASVVLLVVDLDSFKAVNDTHGHAAGDQVLLEVCGRLSASLRDGDQLFRLGGDEFATVFSVHDKEEADLIAARLVGSCRGATCTVSVGGAFAVDGDERVELLARADQALYAAKGAGRDRWLVL
ncbi:MAG: diguanylate cyclase with gaf sensor [Frankiales bacterium]|nr:diguanylate cyclase with gaf sensor [Frankiales bacterium]